jgi:hypothetical protein
MDTLNTIEYLREACKFSKLDDFLYDFISKNSKYTFSDSSGSYECEVIDADDHDYDYAYKLRIIVCPSTSNAEPYEMFEKCATISDIFENEYVAQAVDFSGFLANYKFYVEHPECFEK